jgi:hypothetical protein
MSLTDASFEAGGLDEDDDYLILTLEPDLWRQLVPPPKKQGMWHRFLKIFKGG